jgi:hypothetical protein
VSPNYLRTGKRTARNPARITDGTTFEASCSTAALALEHFTGSLSALVACFGRWNADAQLRFTTKFANVEPLLGLGSADSLVRFRLQCLASNSNDPRAGRLHLADNAQARDE